jgi:hypothetical protein
MEQTMAKQLTRITSTERLEREVREFDAMDSKGRRFGARYTITLTVYDNLPTDATSGWTRAAGTYYVGCPQALRDGMAFGACQQDTHFATLELAQAARAAYFASAEQRALKNKARRA